jgi:hypothetical protein
VPDIGMGALLVLNLVTLRFFTGVACHCASPFALLAFGFLFARVAAEGAGGSKLAELMTDHVLGDVDGHVLAAVMHRDGMPHEIREDGAGAGPGFQDDFLPALFRSSTRERSF